MGANMDGESRSVKRVVDSYHRRRIRALQNAASQFKNVEL